MNTNATAGSGYARYKQLEANAISYDEASEITKALAGELAGVQVANTTGQPGQQSSVRLRGVTSINAGTNPLYVVDGVPYDGDINKLDPSKIKSTTVLKDETATALYGSRGANGVIFISPTNNWRGVIFLPLASSFVYILILRFP